MKELKERLIKAKKLKFMRNVIVGVIALLIAAFIINIAPGYKRDKYKDVVNLIIDEHNVTEDLKNMLYINENKTVYMSEEDVRELFDENIYYDQQYNQIITTSYTKVANIEIEEKFSPMTLKGKQYNKKEMAGKAILEICKTKENSELEEIGEYRGMKLELQINVAKQEFELFLKGNSEYKISLGNDIYGNITRIDNALSNIGKELEENKDELKNTKKQFENEKIDVKIPFDKENELKEKSTRLDRVNALLKLDEKESIIMEDDEKSEDDNLKSQDYDKDPIR